MKHEIKAIQTRYQGYRFRSRLEARWAVFFDACDIKWTYEPEGFLLNNGESYLPDFFLPEEDLYVEVKPHNGDFRKASLFCQSTGKRILLLEDVPELKSYSLLTFDHEAEDVSEEGIRVFFDPLVGGEVMFISTNWQGECAPWWDKNNLAGLIQNYGNHFQDQRALDLLVAGTKKIEDAVSKAKGARFEFGDKP